MTSQSLAISQLMLYVLPLLPLRCLKKYCICFSAGIACNSSKCKCLDCGNGGDEESVASSNRTPLQNETIAPFADLVCVDAEQPLMIDDPPMPLLDVYTLIEEV